VSNIVPLHPTAAPHSRVTTDELGVLYILPIRAGNSRLDAEMLADLRRFQSRRLVEYDWSRGEWRRTWAANRIIESFNATYPITPTGCAECAARRAENEWRLADRVERRVAAIYQAIGDLRRKKHHTTKSPDNRQQQHR
jgi:hypothetical protein